MSNHMVVDDVRPEVVADRVFLALADPTRRDIVSRTLTTERSVSALAANYPMSFAAVQKHVAVLERAGVVTKHKNGREQRVRARIDTIRSTRALLEQYEQIWHDRLARFGDVLADSLEGETQ